MLNSSPLLLVNVEAKFKTGLPISLTLTDTSGATQYVSGMSSTGLDTVASGLTTQNASDGAGWDKLIVPDSAGNTLRVLSPNNGLVGNSSLFSNYFTSYVNQVWQKYTSTSLSVDTQASFGTVAGKVSSNQLTFPNNITFAQPTTGDIFSCSTGPFATGSNTEVNAIIPRLAAAFNRSTLLVSEDAPNVDESQNYQNAITNHYSRIVHAANLDGKGYAFPYDDVTPSGGADQAGTVSSGSVSVFKVTVGGVGATATAPSSSTDVKAPTRKIGSCFRGNKWDIQKKLNHGSSAPSQSPSTPHSTFRDILHKFQQRLHAIRA